MKEDFKKKLLTQTAGTAEWVVFAVWVILVCVIRHFHEPWFDETQAWQIAKFASIKEILTEVCHYEGHPPLWYFVLMPFARMGLPHKITIFAITMVFNCISMYLLLFRSPFPRWLKCYIPFTFFIFYLQSVHTRPYCMMGLAIFLAGMFYKERNQKTARYVLSLIFLCFTSAYGVVIAGGLCIVWTGEILREYYQSKQYRDILKDKRFWWLWVILICALLLYVCCFPAKDVFLGTFSSENFINRVHYFPLFIFDSTFGTVMVESAGLNFKSMIILGCVVGILMWVMFIPLLRQNKKLLVTMIPYLMSTTFSVFVYFELHNLGIFTLFFIFVLWILFDDDMEIPNIYGDLLQKINSSFIKKMGKTIITIVFCMPLLYTAVSSYLEIVHPYGPQEILDFIKENHIENRKILVNWKWESDNPMPWDETLPIKDKMNITLNQPLYMAPMVSIKALGNNDNFYPYYNTCENQEQWQVWKYTTDEENAKIFEQWQKIGLPDLIIGTCPIEHVFSEEQLEGVTYYWIGDYNYGKIWKFSYAEGWEHIYIRSDLLEEYPQFEIQKYGTILTEPIQS